MFEVGQWVKYKRISAFILKVDQQTNRYLLQAPTVSDKAYWIPGDVLKPNDAIQLTDEDIQELKIVAVKSGDLMWYRELSGLTA